MTLVLGFSSSAFATDYTVGSVDDPTNNAYTSLRAAITAANSNGATPHVITIEASYNSVDAGDSRAPGGCDAHDEPLPILSEATTITSAGSAADVSIPPVASRADLTLSNITVHSGLGQSVSPFQGSFARCGGPLVSTLNGTLTMTDAALALRVGDQSGTGIQSLDSDLDLTDVSITGLQTGIDAAQFFAEELSASLTNVNMPESADSRVGARFEGFAGGDLNNVTIDEHSDSGLEFDGGAWVLNGGALTNGGYGIFLGNGAVDIDGTLFDDNLDQAIYALGFPGSPGVHVEARNVSFNAHAGELGGAIFYANSTVNGSLVIEDSTFTNNFSFIGGSIYAIGQVFLDGVVATGSADADASSGGFMRLVGSGIIKNSSFTDFDAERGGVISLGFDDDDFESIADRVLTVEDTTFENTSADLGGVFHIFGGTTAELFDVSATSVFATQSGGFAHLNVLEQDQLQRDERELPVDALTTMANEAGAGGLIMTNVDVTDALAGNGGVIGASGLFNEIEARGLTVTGTLAAQIGGVEALRGIPGGIPITTGGRGGMLWVSDGSRVYLEGLEIEDSVADEYGGLIYSGPSLTTGGVFPSGGIFFDDCRPPLANQDSLLRFSRLGNNITVNGMSVAGVSAGFDAGIAVFSDLDDVSLHGADFVGVRTGSDRRGEVSAPTSSHILTENVTRYDMSCVSVCDAASGSQVNPDAIGGTVRHYEAPGYSSDRTRRPVISHENNVFSYNAASDAVVAIEVCSPEEFDSGFGDSDSPPFDSPPFDSGEFVSELTAEGTFRDTDSGTTIDPRPRGRVDIQFTTFVGSPTSTLIGGTAQDVPVIISNNLFGEGAVGIALDDTDYLFGEYNLFSAVDSVAQDAAAQVFPTPTAVQDLATFSNLVEECSEQELWLADDSPGQDRADPDILDWWNDSQADMGAYGGPDACFPDVDQDGFIVVLDCNDNDLEIRPGANETPYDEIDQDCDGEDWCDVDGDGFISDALTCGGDDCDDARADINPEQTEIWYDGIDQDCSGDDCDQDGDGYAADNAECGGPDCDDLDASVFPGAVETDGDGTDSDCDGADNIPPGCDVDGDGVIADSIECGGIDCNDDDPTIYPGAPETAGDGIDSDCNGDDDPPISEDRCDDDEDGVVAVECGGIDCDDTDATIYTGAEDIPYDGIDQDCDGEDNCDADNDGFDDPQCGGDDCNDMDPTIFPGAGEIPNDGIDQDCDAEDGDLWVQGGPSGCDCSSTGGSAPMGLMWLGALGLVLLRRRRS